MFQTSFPVWHRTLGTRAALLTAVLALAPSAGANLLTNASFEIEGPVGSSTSFTGLGGSLSAAANWSVFNNTEGTTTTELIPGTLPGGGDLMMHVVTTGGSNGLNNGFGAFGSGPPCVMSGVWVYVVSGEMYIGAGNGGNTGPNVFSTTTGAWEYIEAPNTVCPANNYIIYSGFAAGVTEFYVDLASVETFDSAGPAGDLDQNGFVDFGDLVLLLAAWGPCLPGTPCPADLDGNGVVNLADLLMVLATWGACS